MLPAIKQVRECKCEKLLGGLGKFPDLCFCHAASAMLGGGKRRFPCWQCEFL